MYMCECVSVCVLERAKHSFLALSDCFLFCYKNKICYKPVSSELLDPIQNVQDTEYHCSHLFPCCVLLGVQSVLLRSMKRKVTIMGAATVLQ